MIIGASPGYPGAGRVLSELTKVFPRDVRYFDLSVSAQAIPKPDTLILAGWHPDYPKFIEFLKPSKTVVCFTSPPLQSEMVPQELEFLRTILRLLDSGKIHALWLGDKNWLPLIKKEGRKIFYAPYPATLPSKVTGRDVVHPISNVSLFGPLHPRKNVLTQLIAAKIAGVTVHTTQSSGIAVFPTGESMRLKDHGWLPEDEYEKLLLNTIDLGLQVSIPSVESFSYVAWDHISRGIPCLSTASWVPEELQVIEPFNPNALSVQMLSSRVTGEYPSFWRNRAQSHAFRVNHQCREILERELDISLT